MKLDTRRIVLTDVDVERDCQEAKWGQQNHSMLKWLVILMEEVGEASEALLDGYDPKEFRAELVQVAAVAVAAVECIDRNSST